MPLARKLMPMIDLDSIGIMDEFHGLFTEIKNDQVRRNRSKI